MPTGLYIWHYANGWRYWHNYDAVALAKRERTSFCLFPDAPQPDPINPWWCAKFDDDTDERLTESESAMTKEDIISICALHVAEGD